MRNEHTHRWQPFGSDARFEYCKGCGQGRRSDRISDNPLVMRWGKGPAGETCGGCSHLRADSGHARTYLKCDLRTDLTHGAATDQHTGWDACARWELKPDLQRLRDGPGKEKEEDTER